MSLSTIVVVIVVALFISAIAATAGYYLQTRLKRLAQPLRRIPVLSEIAAGLPSLLSEEYIADYLWVEEASAHDADFALRVEGDMMIEAGIQEGDYVLVRQQGIAQNGDIVIAVVNDIKPTAAFLGRLYRNGQGVKLVRESPQLEPMVLQADQGRIIGKVVAVVMEESSPRSYQSSRLEVVQP